MKCFGDVEKEIERLPAGLWERLAFSAACSERLVPFYVCYMGKYPQKNCYILALDYIWSCLVIRRYDEHTSRRFLMECEANIPNEDEAWGVNCPYADDAAAAIVYCLRFMLSEDQQEAVWSAKRTYEVADNFVISHLDFKAETDQSEQEILSNPIIQNELARQLRDLCELQHVVTDLAVWGALCVRLRQKAKSNAIDFLNSELIKLR